MTVKIYTWEIQKEGKKYSKHTDTMLALKNISQLRAKVTVDAPVDAIDEELAKYKIVCLITKKEFPLTEHPYNLYTFRSETKARLSKND